MSISTLDSPSTLRALSQREREWDRLEAEEREVRAEIHTAFAAMTKVPAKTLIVNRLRTVGLAGGGTGERERPMPLSDAITETIEGGNVNAELFAVLEKSSCPLVASLRKALEKSWADSVARDVAYHRAGDWA